RARRTETSAGIACHRSSFPGLVPPADDRMTTFLDAARVEVDHALERYLPKPPACPAIVSEAMRYSVFAGGKRLRPVLVLAAADAGARRGCWGLAAPPP